MKLAAGIIPAKGSFRRSNLRLTGVLVLAARGDTKRRGEAELQEKYAYIATRSPPPFFPSISHSVDKTLPLRNANIPPDTLIT